jgi:LEA14-like dessication related protein
MKKVYCVLFAFTLLLSCGKIEEPQFRRLQDFGLKSFGLQESVVGFSVIYYNPNNIGVTVKEAAFDIFIDNVFLGKFNQTNNVDVDRNAEFSIPMEGKLSVQTALKMNLQNLIGKEVLIKAVGNVKVGKAGIFTTKAITYEGKQRINADLLKNPAGAGL